MFTTSGVVYGPIAFSQRLKSNEFPGRECVNLSVNPLKPSDPQVKSCEPRKIPPKKVGCLVVDPVNFDQSSEPQ